MIIKHRTVVYLALLVAQAVILSLVERLLPTPILAFPAIKLGLANLITLIAYKTVTWQQTWLVITARLLLVTLLGGTISLLLYSSAGAFVSFFGLLAADRLSRQRFSLIGLSMLAGFLHLAGQLAVVCLITQSFTILYSASFFAVLGLSSGWVIGVLATLLFPKIQQLPLAKKAGS